MHVAVKQKERALQQGFLVMPHYMLVLFRRPPETFFAIVTPVWIFFSVDGYDVPFETRSVRSVVLAILALIDLATAVRLHVLLKFVLMPKSTLAPLALKRQVLGVNGQNVAAQREGVRRLVIAVPALVHFIPLVRFSVLFQFGGSVEALLAHVALVREVFGVHRDDVALQVAGVGAFVFAVRTLVSLVALEDLRVRLELLVVGEGLRTVATLEGQVCAVFALYVSL